ncbi:hypothetical protein [Chondrinema litorale]|uniref:hypothetical protein n=1 Tax=Chondrinema litorale TaxID=2994555 RepID=UPI00254324E2|nr:hypothetical protein [Chondrinema litorale]UZR95811.1 hypothetical protein OQ292_08295 [Chondrinema litorale]
MRYCTEYQYLSDKATDLHFSISFGAILTYKKIIKPSFIKELFGEKDKVVVIEEKTQSVTYGLKQVRWYNLTEQKRASIEEEILLNKLKQSVIDPENLKQAALIRKSGVVQAGSGKEFPVRNVDVILDTFP